MVNPRKIYLQSIIRCNKLLNDFPNFISNCFDNLNNDIFILPRCEKVKPRPLAVPMFTILFVLDVVMKYFTTFMQQAKRVSMVVFLSCTPVCRNCVIANPLERLYMILNSGIPHERNTLLYVCTLSY